MSIDASAFGFNTGTHIEYLKIAYTSLVEAYQQQITNSYNATNINENSIRNDIVIIAKTKKNFDLPFRWITEFPDIDNNNRIDIDLATPLSLIDESNAIKIECKIVGEDKYIDTKKSFERTNSQTNGIMSFITGKYSPKMPVAGMIGFIKEENINIKIKKIKKRLEKHSDITTLQNLKAYLIKDDFKYSYFSIHDRDNDLRKISLYHLFFDYS